MSTYLLSMKIQAENEKQALNILKNEIGVDSLRFKKVEDIEFTRVNSDCFRNPRYVTHYLNLLKPEESGSIKNTYALAVKRANKIGGRKYNTKSYGGGIVFQSYNIDETRNQIKELLK